MKQTREGKRRRAQTRERHNREFLRKFKNSSNKKGIYKKESYETIAQRLAVFLIFVSYNQSKFKFKYLIYRKYRDRLNEIKEKFKPMNHKQIRQFSQNHIKNMNKRKIMKKEKLSQLNNKELKQKLRKVAKDKHNFFMRNNTKGNNSIMAQDTHPSRKKLIVQRTIKRKQYERDLKQKIEHRIKTINQKQKNQIGIPKTQNISILIGNNPSNTVKDSRVFAFGSSMVVTGNIVKESREQINQREYQKLQNRKKMGKQYLEELKNNRIIRKQEIVLGPRNTKILEDKQNSSGYMDKDTSTKTMLKIEMNMDAQEVDNITSSVRKDSIRKKFIIIDQPTRRKKKVIKPEKENMRDKKHINYLKMIKVGRSTLETQFINRS